MAPLTFGNKVTLTWETIDSKGMIMGAGTVLRAWVPSGWLVVLKQNSITFVPDPNHTWK